MKKIHLTILLFIFPFMIFSQNSLPMKLINNTEKDILIFLVAHGTDPFDFGCDMCSTVKTNSTFILNANSSLAIEEFSDVPSNWQIDVLPCSSDCTGINANACGLPIFEYLRFGYPAPTPGIGGNLGKGDCAGNIQDSFFQDGFTGSWQIINNEIIVTFDFQ